MTRSIRLPIAHATETTCVDEDDNCCPCLRARGSSGYCILFGQRDDGTVRYQDGYMRRWPECIAAEDLAPLRFGLRFKSMTPSIVRLFARYHGLILERTDDASVVTEAYGIAPLARHVHSPATNNWSAFRDACDKIIQSLTRIEDAEMLLGRVAEANKTLAYPGMDDNIVASTVRDFYAFDVNRLLVLAGVNPAKWREAKDE